MPEPTREELLRERESFNLSEHLQSLKDASAKIVAVTEQEIRDFANELADKAGKEAARLRVGEEMHFSPESLGLPADDAPVTGSGVVTEISGNSFTIASETPTESETPNAD